MNGNPQLSDRAGNVIENLACRIAERSGGRIAANHLLPYLPVSLAVVDACLAEMVDGTSVLTEEADNVRWYEFPAYSDSPPRDGMLAVETCVACDTDVPRRPGRVVCPACTDVLRHELNALADRTAWPAQAVYEHEVLHLAADHGGPVRAEALAGRSRYTLRNMRGKLEAMTLGKHLRQELNSENGALTYHFPRINYPKDLYRRNAQVIREYPASMTEELQLRLVRIIIALAILMFGLFALAFFGVPFPILVASFFVGGIALAAGIWMHRIEPAEE